MPIIIRSATGQDHSAIRRILAESDLPSEDIMEHLPHFLVAEEGDEMVGTVGLEVRGPEALLRSLAVIERLRGKGVGGLLYSRMVEKARSLGVRELGLLTTTAEGFFRKVGFKTCDKKDIPLYISSSKEYTTYCPSTAVCMTKTLTGA